MLFTYLSTALCIGALVLAAWCLRQCVLSEIRAQAAEKYCEDAVIVTIERSEKSEMMRRLNDIELELTNQADMVEKTHQMMHKLRTRQGMRDHREKKNAQESEIPDSVTDPAGYKRYMRLKIAEKNLT